LFKFAAKLDSHPWVDVRRATSMSAAATAPLPPWLLRRLKPATATALRVPTDTT